MRYSPCNLDTVKSLLSLRVRARLQRPRPAGRLRAKKAIVGFRAQGREGARPRSLPTQRSYLSRLAAHPVNGRSISAKLGDRLYVGLPAILLGPCTLALGDDASGCFLLPREVRDRSTRMVIRVGNVDAMVRWVNRDLEKVSKAPVGAAK